MDQLDKSLQDGPKIDQDRPLSRATRARLGAGQAYFANMARILVGSLGPEEAAACAIRHHWVGLLPLVEAEGRLTC